MFSYLPCADTQTTHQSSVSLSPRLLRRPEKEDQHPQPCHTRCSRQPSIDHTLPQACRDQKKKRFYFRISPTKRRQKQTKASLARDGTLIVQSGRIKLQAVEKQVILKFCGLVQHLTRPLACLPFLASFLLEHLVSTGARNT